METETKTCKTIQELEINIVNVIGLPLSQFTANIHNIEKQLLMFTTIHQHVCKQNSLYNVYMLYNGKEFTSSNNLHTCTYKLSVYVLE